MIDPSKPDLDLAPGVSSETDVSRLGRGGPVPPHEKTADEDTDVVDWEQVAAMPEFRSLIRAKVRFIVPATAFYVVYYFALPVLVGWFPESMRRRIGPVNLAYLFALSQFFMAWGLAFVYVRRAGDFDKRAAQIVAAATGGQR